MATDPGQPGPLELLVVQPTPFCNINCSYCYLPDRQSTKQMSLETLERTFAWVFSSGLAREPFTLLWHAGEPLVVAPAFYEQAIVLLDRYNLAGVSVYHALQTKLQKRYSNGVTILNSFTWSKAIDYASGHLETNNGDTSRWNLRDVPNERGLSGYDRRFNDKDAKSVYVFL